VLVSELIIPIVGGNTRAARDLAEDLAETIQGEADFARAARENSAAPSRVDGGQLGWMPLTNLPPAARGAMVQLRPGQVSSPIPVPGGIALFQLRGIQQGGDISPGNITVDYATFVTAGPEDAARVRAAVDACDDLYPLARGAAGDRITRATVAERAVPGDLAGTLATLDDNETAVVTRGGAAVVVMLCARRATVAEGGARPAPADAAPGESVLTAEGVRIPPIDADLGYAAGPQRGDVRSEILNQRLGGLADAYLEELKADAVIVRP
jgi:peptidyl-prolyl cis-trans isomerase SurA